MYKDVYKDEEYLIYTLDELENLDPKDPDIVDTISDSVYVSMVVNMWIFCGYKTDIADILNECRTNPRFMYEYTWTKEQRAEYEHIIHKQLVRLLDMSPAEAWHEIEMWSAFGNAFSLEKKTREYHDEYRKLVKDLVDLETCDD